MSPPGDSNGGGMSMTTNMVTTVLAFSVSAFFVLFVFVRLLCARLHLRADHHAARAGDAFVVQTYNVGRGIRGLEPSVVTGFPTVKLSDGAPRSPGQESSQCTVCLEEYAAKDVVRVLPACGHAFHAACIDAWLRQQPTCPVCRASLRANKNQNHHPPLDHGFAAAAAGAPASRPEVQVPASTSGVTASSPPPAPADQTMDTGPATLLEIVTEEPGSSADHHRSEGAVGPSGAERVVGASVASADTDVNTLSFQIPVVSRD